GRELNQQIIAYHAITKPHTPPSGKRCSATPTARNVRTNTRGSAVLEAVKRFTATTRRSKPRGSPREGPLHASPPRPPLEAPPRDQLEAQAVRAALHGERIDRLRDQEQAATALVLEVGQVLGMDQLVDDGGIAAALVGDVDLPRAAGDVQPHLHPRRLDE